MLVGAIGYDDVQYAREPDGRLRRSETASYNSVFSIVAGRVTGRYDKVHLTPFGEVMPYISAWPWLEQTLLGFAAAGMAFDLSAADEPRVLQVPVARGDPGDFELPDRAYQPVRIATPVCFESTDAALCRRLVNLAENGSGAPFFIVNPTNDGWFGASDAGREHHLQLARWRAVENAVPVVRAANTGISCAIDHRGRVTARGVRTPDGPIVDARADGVLVADLHLVGIPTLYSRNGDSFGWSLMALALLAMGAACIPLNRPRPPNSQSSPAPGR
jgi:apolipoprotein N-acyltransferase